MESSREPLLPLHSTNFKLHPSLNSLLSKSTLHIALGPLSCILICLSGILDGHGASRNMLGITAWIFAWWLTGAVPVAITALAPLYLFPILGIAPADVVAKSYMSDVIALLLGSFILVIAVEHYNIHQRLALNVALLFCGDPMSPRMLLMGISGTTAFISFWMQNTAAAVMMMPVAMGIINRFPIGVEGNPDIDRYSKAVIMGVTYASEIGGIATLTGAAANMVAAALWASHFPEERPIGFTSWSMFGLPLAMILFFSMWAILCLYYVPKSAGDVLAAHLDRSHLRRELELLGPMAFAEKMVLSVFGLLVVLWMTRSLTEDIPGWGSLFPMEVGDGTVSVLMASLLFVIPNGKQEGEKLMDWEKCKKLQWNVILLLGGGLVIADGVRTSGLAELLSTELEIIRKLPQFMMGPLACVVGSIITEFAPNNATVTLVAPILLQLAKTVNVHPLLLMIPGTIGAEFAYMLPTATPSNIVGLSTGRFSMKDMILAGILLKIVGILAVSIVMPTLGVLAFGISNTNFYGQ